MSVVITRADRIAAEIVESRVSRRVNRAKRVDDIAHAIADARMAERDACVAWVRDWEGDGVAEDLISARASEDNS